MTRAAWLAALVAVCAGAAACGAGTATPKASSPSPSSVSTVLAPSPTAPPLAPYARSAVQLGGTPSEVAEGFGSIWVVNHRGAEVTRVDPVSGRVLKHVEAAGGQLVGVAVGAGHVWYLSSSGQHLEGIDPAKNAVTVQVPVEADGGILSANDHWVWFAGTSGKVVRVSPAGKVVAQRRLAARDTFLGASLGGSRLWVADPDHSTLYGLDPMTLDVKVTRHLKGDVALVRPGFGSLWVGAFGGPLYRLDPTTGALRSTVALPAVDHLAMGPGLVWVRVSDVKLVGIDPRTNRVAKSYDTLPASEVPGGGVLWRKNELWVVNWTEGDVWRIPEKR